MQRNYREKQVAESMPENQPPAALAPRPRIEYVITFQNLNHFFARVHRNRRNPCQSQRTRRQKCVIQAIRQADLVRRHSHRDTEPDWEDGKLHCKEKQQHQRQPEGRRSRDHDAIARNQAIHPLFAAAAIPKNIPTLPENSHADRRSHTDADAFSAITSSTGLRYRREMPKSP